MKKVLIFLLLFLIPLSHAQSEVLATSYWGYITENSIPKSNFSITILDTTGKEVVKSTSNQDGLYQITVPWDDPATPVNEGVVANETISFKVEGKIAASRVIDAKGSNNRLDLLVTTNAATSTPTSVPTSTPPSGGGWAPTPTAMPAPNATQTQAVTQTATPVQTVAETPEQTSTPVPVSTPAKKTPGFGVIAAVIVLIYLAIRIK